jgi:hypothetical protein
MAFMMREADAPAGLLSLHTLALSEGDPQALYRPSQGARIQAVAWTPDDRQLVVAVGKSENSGASPSAEGEGARFWLVPAGGGAPRDMGFNVKRLHADLQVRPDGRQLAYTAGWYQEELWVMENLLPAAKK